MTPPSRRTLARAFVLFAVAGLVPAACVSPDGPGVEPANASFPLTRDAAKAELDEMRRDRVALERPLIVATGYMDPGSSLARMVKRYRSLVSNPDWVIGVPFFTTVTFDSCRERVIDKLEAKFPSGDPDWTVEVDVVGLSMGGLVARHAASPRTDGGKRLRINRLFTLGTPHRGAQAAAPEGLDRRVPDMSEGSDFLRRLDELHDPGAYEIFAYVRLGDELVGESNATPPSGSFWWLPTPPLQSPHLNIQDDLRMTADIARRLRNEPAYATEPALPLPERPDDE